VLTAREATVAFAQLSVQGQLHPHHREDSSSRGPAEQGNLQNVFRKIGRATLL